MLLEIRNFLLSYGWIVFQPVCICMRVCVCVCVYLTFSLSISPLVDTQAVSMSSLLRIIWQRIWGFRYCFKMRFCFLWIYNIYPEVGLLDQCIFNFLRNCHILSPVALSVCILTKSEQGFLFLHILASTCYLLTGVRWYTIVVLIWIFLILNLFLCT